MVSDREDDLGKCSGGMAVSLRILALAVGHEICLETREFDEFFGLESRGLCHGRIHTNRGRVNSLYYVFDKCKRCAVLHASICQYTPI